MQFPSSMTDARRWLVRPDKSKQPFSPLAERPEGYVPGMVRSKKTNKEKPEGPNYWRFRWRDPLVWVSYEEALAYLADHPDTCEGLSFVLHPAGDFSESPRIICFDFDKAIDPATGRAYVEVQDFIDRADSFVEYSRSGEGLHLFVVMKCAPFINVLGEPVAGRCKVDILCSAQIAVTGRVYE